MPTRHPHRRRGTRAALPASRVRSLPSRFPIAAAFLAAVIVTLPSPAGAGTVHEAFADRLEAAAPSEVLSGLVMMREQVDLAGVERGLRARSWTSRWRRHQEVLVAAQDIAARTQPPLLAELRRLQILGQVRSFRSLWISNVVVVEATPAVFRRLAARDDLGTIYENIKIELRLGWEDGGPAPIGGKDILPDNLICVNVGPAWSEGFRGAGRIVAVFDTGVKGDHEALATRWRGAIPGVDWSWAWLDPYGGTHFPYDIGWHGTHVTGIVLGEKPDGTPIGVAPDASWIAAALLNHYTVENALECYQWGVDPDGDPGTLSDVPDVINNSWGTGGDCDSTYWNAIDVVEAAGIVNTISVDNSGPAPYSVNSPESRATSATVNFGVGNIDPHQPGYPIHSTSGRGPSPCDSASVKPEVTAPGTQIYSSVGNGGYANLTGTSMACPHVSGAVAILRQVNPDLTVEEIKTVLMQTAFDRGDAGEDNDYGWGIIDITAAVDQVRTTFPNYPPGNLQATVQDPDVSLTWGSPLREFPSHPVLAYRIYRTPAGEPFPETPIAELDSSQVATNYDDLGVPPGTWRYVVTALYADGESGPSNEVEAFLVDPEPVFERAPSDPSLLLAAPNPFSGATVVRFRAHGTGPVTLALYDAGGARVRTLLRGAAIPEGSAAAPWDGRDESGHRLPRGTYFLRLEEEGRTLRRAVTLLE